MTSSPAARDVLTQAEAEARAARVTGASYELHLRLARGAATYRGDATVAFALTGAGDTFLDFRGKAIEKLVVNGRDAEPRWTGYRLTLPAALLAERNTVRIVYENEYDHTGDGLHQFIDPEDGEEYVYTNFEPYEAHRLFPCFDQPDIKATYALTVDAPAEWTLIANSREGATAPAAGGLVRHEFETTRRFSTYLFAMIGGPYHAFRDRHGDVDLGFFCRRSLVEHVDEGELFAITKQGLDFYASFFDYPYPFGKYDQIFVPEFNAGAMENVAAVTHSERMVFRDPPTENQRLSRAEVLLHEMAHMWFGNLVTMRWWNDLWLNESFATYMAYLSLAEATRFTHAWQAFNAGMKSWAYRQDQLITTHPIAAEIGDTDETFLNFDGITYGKGAAVIQQLVAAMGMDGFREGMRRYFRRHEYGNTTLSQFLDALQEGMEAASGGGRDLHEWARLWLETSSLNTIAATYDLDGARLTGLRLKQLAPDAYPTLRPHRLDIALVHDDGERVFIDELAAEIDGAETAIGGAAGMPAPSLVFPNHHDLAFVKVALDDASVAYIRAHLERIDDPLLRQLIWQSLWNMVRDQQLSSIDYLRLAAGKVRIERDKELVETILANAQAAIGRYVPEDRRLDEAHRFFEAAWAALNEAGDTDSRIIWARTLLGLAVTPDDIRHTGRLADGELVVPGLVIDQDMRWDIAARYVAYGIDGAGARVAAERERDPSDRGQRESLRCEVSRPDAAVKAEAWRRFHEEGYGSLHLTAAAMSGFQWTVQRDLIEPYAELFFASARGVFESRENEFARSYFRGLFPGYRVERATLALSNRLLDGIAEGELPLLRRSLREANDDLERAIRCREFAARPG